MTSSADSKYYKTQQVDSIKNLKHEGSNLKRNPKGYKAAAGDMRTADNKYYRSEADTFAEEQNTVRTSASNLVIDETNIDAAPSLIANMLKTSDKVVVVCEKELLAKLSTKLQLSIGQLVLTEEQLFKVSVTTPVVELAEVKATEPPKVTEEPTAEEPTTVEEPKVTEEPKVEDEND